MNFSQAASAISNKYPALIKTVDSHTAGEATRLVVDGVGQIPGETMRAKREYFMRNQDRLRQLLTREPRGHRDMVAAVLTEPCTPGADFGLIYMDARRYPYLCGHATIGAVTTMIEAGLIKTDPESKVTVDTPSGPMNVTTIVENSRVRSVTYRSVPAFVQDMGRRLEVSGHGMLEVDMVCAGGFFAMIDADQTGLELTIKNANVLVPLGMRVIEAANEHLSVSHPERVEVGTVDAAEFYQEIEPGRGRGFVVYGEGHMDRSPCGTGTTAKLALLHAKGLIKEGEHYVNMSPLGTEFTAWVAETTKLGAYPAIIAEITGMAHITGIHEFILIKDDPFPEGYLL